MSAFFAEFLCFNKIHPLKKVIRITYFSLHIIDMHSSVCCISLASVLCTYVYNERSHELTNTRTKNVIWQDGYNNNNTLFQTIVHMDNKKKNKIQC